MPWPKNIPIDTKIMMLHQIKVKIWLLLQFWQLFLESFRVTPMFVILNYHILTMSGSSITLKYNVIWCLDPKNIPIDIKIMILHQTEVKICSPAEKCSAKTSIFKYLGQLSWKSDNLLYMQVWHYHNWIPWPWKPNSRHQVCASKWLRSRDIVEKLDFATFGGGHFVFWLLIKILKGAKLASSWFWLMDGQGVSINKQSS